MLRTIQFTRLAHPTTYPFYFFPGVHVFVRPNSRGVGCDIGGGRSITHLVKQRTQNTEQRTGRRL